jgi:hypothetical protein
MNETKVTCHEFERHDLRHPQGELDLVNFLSLLASGAVDAYRSFVWIVALDSVITEYWNVV